MDLKEAKAIDEGRVSATQFEEDMAKGFLDAIDQLKATGLLDAAKDVEDFLQSDDMGRQWRDEVLVKLREAIAKLNALLGEI